MKSAALAVAMLLLPLSAFAQGMGPRCPEIRAAQFHLAQTRVNLEKGAHDFQGHRVKALELVKAAEAELAQAAAVKGCR